MRGYVTGNGYFKYKEFVVSNTFPLIAKRIKLSNYDKAKIKLHVEQALDPWRLSHKRHKLKILSGKRNATLNKRVGGSAGSDHLYCCACDCTSNTLNIELLFSSIINMNLPYRQLILYRKRNFIHWSWNIPGRSYKHEVLFK